MLLNGDGNGNPADKTTLTKAPAYSDLIDLWGSLSPYELNAMLASTDAMKDILNIAEMKDAEAGLDFQGTGRVITPLGAKLYHVPSMASGSFLGLDKNCALEMVQAGEVLTDYDKLIDRQLERAAISTIAGFAKIFDGAVKAVSYTS